MQRNSTLQNIDWITVILYLLLVAAGWMNIYSASLSDTAVSFTNLDNIYAKQLFFIGLSLVLIVFILAVDAKFYERFSSVIYLIALASLLGLFIFGKDINGARSWYSFGSFGLQPSEFAKAAAALALSKYLSDIQTNVKLFDHQLKAFLIILLPALLIVPQPDPGSALIFTALIFPLYREGLHFIYLLLGFIAAFLFIATLLIGVYWVAAAVAVIALLLWFKNRKKKRNLGKYVIITGACVAFAFSVSYIFNNVFEQRHRDRFNIVLGKEVDTRGIGYNTNQSEIAIGSGGFLGKGWTKGTQTKGNFVPEQHTDYIFSTVGEEWGFLGSIFVVILFLWLIIRLLILAERQKQQFARVYGYSVAAILFFHFFVNIGMVTGLFPTVGIPLPFFSYGGSALWGFTILLFIFVKLDSSNFINR
ncbi:rod shape-determining protein RodA [Gilvibacter sediminis]|uniref:rod shape-determining protein RodA n=1 Tax=Gilvibacter sediminis TaxID=379071 RepID=UPI0023500EDD|nr:rod shape-determining protein RodA [Gilvibacter sediminis]MDC7997410.1 rod shape-determining protein RodA [Gilvibacter sediminis]